MRLEIAVERLMAAGWHPINAQQLESLPDGRKYPSVAAVRREFADAGLELFIQHKMMFSCYRATWAPVGETMDPDSALDERHGTVVAACENEAAVYALAQLRSSQLALT